MASKYSPASKAACALESRCFFWALAGRENIRAANMARAMSLIILCIVNCLFLQLDKITFFFYEYKTQQSGLLFEFERIFKRRLN